MSPPASISSSKGAHSILSIIIHPFERLMSVTPDTQLINFDLSSEPTQGCTQRAKKSPSFNKRFVYCEVFLLLLFSYVCFSRSSPFTVVSPIDFRLFVQNHCHSQQQKIESDTNSIILFYPVRAIYRAVISFNYVLNGAF